MHAAQACQEEDVSESPVHDSESTASTLPKMKKTAQVVPTRGPAAAEGTTSSSKEKAKEKGKASDNAEETKNEEADKEVEEEDAQQE